MSRSLFINGQWRPGHGPELASIDPATGEAVWREVTAAAADVSAAVAAAPAGLSVNSSTVAGSKSVGDEPGATGLDLAVVRQ